MPVQPRRHLCYWLLIPLLQWGQVLLGPAGRGELTYGDLEDESHYLYLEEDGPFAEEGGSAHCRDDTYLEWISLYCWTTFHATVMATPEWSRCQWEQIGRIYSDLSNCTVLMAEALSCPWPSPALDSFFLQIHMEYFTNCTVPASSRPSQPPLGLVLAMAAVPACLTPLLALSTLSGAPPNAAGTRRPPATAGPMEAATKLVTGAVYKSPKLELQGQDPGNGPGMSLPPASPQFGAGHLAGQQQTPALGSGLRPAGTATPGANESLAELQNQTVLEPEQPENLLLDLTAGKCQERPAAGGAVRTELAVLRPSRTPGIPPLLLASKSPPGTRLPLSTNGQRSWAIALGVSRLRQRGWGAGHH
ncbi:Choline-phosphate cytidylyltransferase B [Platysternon megacephalum]|uniref:Choline-phosphate cytidylyltransferase B n=1 Tax=Platysternon megacephalum TaxID=55544 RepID=A0A4D9ETW7_9SAUR|nr:Choline-phosphate cytidylyltransferase B [Platysternon megacephalum]